MSYKTAHVRVLRLKGRASDYTCVDRCGREAQDWSYSGGAPDEQIDARDQCYSLIPDFYVPRCRSCHAKYDNAARRAQLPEVEKRPKEKLFNWSIRLSQAESAVWDELVRTIRVETGNRSVKKSDIARRLMAMADDPEVRPELLRVLRERRAS